jgi:hypothetical protein
MGFLLACDNAAEEVPPDVRRIAWALTDSANRLIPAGLADTVAGFLVGRLGGATRVGSRLALLDLLPPHIKIFDSTGAGVSSFLTTGDGPGQMRMPVALTTWDDSTIVIADVSGSLAAWNISGRLLREGRGVPGLAIMGMVRCGERLVLYGPSIDSTATGEPTWVWLRELAADLATIELSGLRETMEPGEIHGVGGKVYGISVTSDSLLNLRHQFGPAPRVLQVRCSDLQSGHALLNLPPSVRMPRSSAGGGPVTPPRTTGPRPAGLAAFGDKLVLADLLVASKVENQDSTRFIVIAHGRIDSITVAGRHQLMGSTDEVALVMESDPYPGVRVVREQSY